MQEVNLDYQMFSLFWVIYIYISKIIKKKTVDKKNKVKIYGEKSKKRSKEKKTQNDYVKYTNILLSLSLYVYIYIYI